MSSGVGAEWNRRVMIMAASSVLLHQGVLTLAAILLIAAAVSDAMSYRIPNAVSLALLVLFPVYVITAPSAIAWGQHLFVAVVVLAAGFFMFTRQYIGAGDVKLLGAASLWAGPGLLDLLLFITAIAGGLLAIATAGVTYYRRRRGGSPGKASLAKERIPYGVAIAIGGLCTLIMLFHPALLS
ncbi:MAG: prepilin peptidase [Alphaproteobacteria bacterium]|nr:prepilin peptidase [Alphaproteobacteria bacterium]